MFHEHQQRGAQVLRREETGMLEGAERERQQLRERPAGATSNCRGIWALKTCILGRLLNSLVRTRGAEAAPGTPAAADSSCQGRQHRSGCGTPTPLRGGCAIAGGCSVLDMEIPPHRLPQLDKPSVKQPRQARVLSPFLGF